MKKAITTMAATVIGIALAGSSMAFDINPKVIKNDRASKIRLIKEYTTPTNWMLTKSDIIFVKEEICTDGTVGHGANTWIRLTIKNNGPTIMQNVKLKMCILEFEENPAANINFAPHNWESGSGVLQRGQEYTFEYRLSTEVYAVDEHHILNRHYKAEIIVDDANQENNTLTRVVDTLNRNSDI